MKTKTTHRGRLLRTRLEREAYKRRPSTNEDWEMHFDGRKRLYHARLTLIFVLGVLLTAALGLVGALGIANLGWATEISSWATWIVAIIPVIAFVTWYGISKESLGDSNSFLWGKPRLEDTHQVRVVQEVETEITVGDHEGVPGDSLGLRVDIVPGSQREVKRVPLEDETSPGRTPRHKSGAESDRDSDESVLLDLARAILHIARTPDDIVVMEVVDPTGGVRVDFALGPVNTFPAELVSHLPVVQRWPQEVDAPLELAAAVVETLDILDVPVPSVLREIAQRVGLPEAKTPPESLGESQQEQRREEEAHLLLESVAVRDEDTQGSLDGEDIFEGMDGEDIFEGMNGEDV